MATAALLAPIYLEPFSRTLRPLYGVLYFFDCTLALYVVLELFTMAQFLAAYTLSSTLVSFRHIQAFYRPLEADIRKLKNSQNCSKIASLFSYQSLLVEHQRLTFIYLRLSEHLFGLTSYLLVLTLLPINVYCVAVLVLGRQFGPIKGVYLIIIFIQSVVMAGSTLPAQLTAVLHRPAKFIPNLQWIVLTQKKILSCKEQQLLKLKLKYDSLMLMLTSGPKIAVRVGPLQQLTKSNLYEVC